MTLNYLACKKLATSVASYCTNYYQIGCFLLHTLSILGVISDRQLWQPVDGATCK